MGFLNGFFLYGLAAAAVPVLIHLVRQATAPTVPFPSLMLLQDVKSRQRKRTKIKDILLMLLRAGMLVLLALLFARPFHQDASIALLSTDERTSTVLLMDVSMSMRAGDRFEAAKDDALSRIAAARDGDEFSVVHFDETARQASALSDDMDLHRVAVADMDPGFRTTNINQALQYGHEILSGARHERRKLVLISDMQRSGWGETVEPWMLPPGVEYEPSPTEGVAEANARIEDFALLEKRKEAGTSVQYEARIQGLPPGRDGSVFLEVDGTRVHEAALSSRFSYLQNIAEQGRLEGRIVIPDDPLEADNTFYFTHAVEGPPGLLVVDSGTADARRDRLYLQTAFTLAGYDLFAYDSGSPGRLTTPRLSEVGLLVLSNLETISVTQIDAVERFVSEGGGLIIGFGGASDPTAYRPLFARLQLGAIDGLSGMGDGRTTDVIIGDADMQHPVFRSIAESGTGAVFRPRFSGFAQLRPDSTSRVIASFDSGDPMLVESSFGQGTMLVYASSFGSSWTDFPIHESFIPFVYEMAGHAVGTAQPPRYVVGSTVLLEGRPGQTWDVRAPEDQQHQISAGPDGIAPFRSTDVPGHYLAVSENERYPFSVNVDPEESDLSYLDPEEAYAAVRVSRPETGLEDEGGGRPPEVEARQPLWIVALLLLIVLYTVESVLSHRSRPGTHIHKTDVST